MTIAMLRRRGVRTGCSLFLGAVGLLLAGCSQVTLPPEPAVPPEVARADALFQQGRMADAILACAALNRRDPLMPGLAELQGRITTELAERRQQAHAARAPASDRAALTDIGRQELLPETYRLVRPVTGMNGPVQTLPNAMQQALRQPVSIHLDNVGLSEIVREISKSTNINIVADGDLGGKTISVHVENTPIAEVLEYVGRNMGVTFSVGQNIIWVTQGNTTSGKAPLFTRIYRLRKGLSGEELEGGPEKLGIIEAIERFVPETEGADALFNLKAHALLVKNTRENLALIEDLVAVLDIKPPQVLIEARFISTGITDLSELGVDWLINGPITVNNKNVVINGGVLAAPKTQIASGATIGYTPFANSVQGMNFTYEGVLTDPAFQAVVHALELSGKSRTLSVPRVTTVNNREASLRIGEDFRFFEEFDIQEVRTGVTPEGRDTYESRLVPTGTPTLEELGIELVVTPSVGADLATINLRLVPEISEFVRWEYYAAESASDSESDSSRSSTNVATGLLKLPIFRRSKIDTEVQVRSGDTVIMGGLVTSTRVKSRSGTPVLSWLPLIGQLFRHDTIDEVRQNLLIFVTATLISDVGEELIPLGPIEPLPTDGKVSLGEPEPSAPPPTVALPLPAVEAPAPAAPPPAPPEP